MESPPLEFLAGAAFLSEVNDLNQHMTSSGRAPDRGRAFLHPYWVSIIDLVADLSSPLCLCASRDAEQAALSPAS